MYILGVVQVHFLERILVQYQFEVLYNVHAKVNYEVLNWTKCFGDKLIGCLKQDDCRREGEKVNLLFTS